MPSSSVTRSGIKNYARYLNTLSGNVQLFPSSAAMQLIETVTVGAGGASTATFSNLNTYANTYQHLQIRMAVRTTRSDANNDQIALQFNLDTGSNYTRHELVADGASVSANGAVTQDGIRFREIETAQSTANVFNAIVVDILDPFETTKNTTIKALNGTASRSRILLSSGYWANSAQISTIKLTPIASFAQYSRVSLYGIKAV